MNIVVWINIRNYSAYIKQHREPSLSRFVRQIYMNWFSLNAGDWLCFSNVHKFFHWSSVKVEVSILLSILYNLNILNSHNGTSVIRYSWEHNSYYFPWNLVKEWQINKFKYYGDLHIYISKNLLLGSAEGHEYPDLQVGDEVDPRLFLIPIKIYNIDPL